MMNTNLKFNKNNEYPTQQFNKINNTQHNDSENKIGDLPENKTFSGEVKL